MHCKIVIKRTRQVLILWCIKVCKWIFIGNTAKTQNTNNWLPISTLTSITCLSWLLTRFLVCDEDLNVEKFGFGLVINGGVLSSDFEIGCLILILQYWRVSSSISTVGFLSTIGEERASSKSDSSQSSSWSSLALSFWETFLVPGLGWVKLLVLNFGFDVITIELLFFVVCNCAISLESFLENIEELHTNYVLCMKNGRQRQAD